MRYYAIDLNLSGPLLRWVQFPQRRRWLDLEAGSTRLTAMLVGEGAVQARPGITDRAGQPIASAVLPPSPVPQGVKTFDRLPAEQRQMVDLEFTFPGPVPVNIIDQRDGRVLAVLEPKIRCPEYIFALTEEMRRDGFAPEGFANFIETGTLFAHTTLHAGYWFDHVTTIELSEALHAQAQRHLAHRPNVTCVQGNSGDRLAGVVAGLRGPSFFFLDAHFSGDSSTDWSSSRFAGYPVDTARIRDDSLSEGERQVPLWAEFEAIMQGHADRALVLIDDWQASGKVGEDFDGEDWSHVQASEMITYMEAQPRTQRHFPTSWNRYAWLIGPK